MALRIEKAFGVNMEMLLRIQTAWNIAIIRQRGHDLHVKRFQQDHASTT
jgi:antitoxin HigA-1